MELRVLLYVMDYNYISLDVHAHNQHYIYTPDATCILDVRHATILAMNNIEFIGGYRKLEVSDNVGVKR